MPGFWDDQTAPFECPQCQHEIPIPIGRLQEDPLLVDCPACGVTIAVEAKQAREDLRRHDQTIDDLKKRVRQLGGKVT